MAEKKPKKRRWPWILLAIFLLLVGAVSGGLWSAYLYFSYDLPKLDRLSDYRPKTISRFYAEDGTIVAEFYEERREVVPLHRIPQHLINAFVAAEDSKFFQHPGVDLKAILRAAIRNVEAGRIVQGGSTITQQVCKSLLLTPAKHFSRKIKEAILAYRIDKKFSKDEVLYLYFNQIYLGEGAYGVETASQIYFSKSVEDLTLAECAMLAGLPQSPSRYSPRSYPRRARRRQLYVLNRMSEDGYITPEQAREAAREVVTISSRRPKHVYRAPYFVEHVRRLIEEKYGSKALLQEGLQVYTTLSLERGEEAEKALLKGLADLDKREGYRGPLNRLDPAERQTFLHQLAQQNPASELVPGKVLAGVVLQVSVKRAVVHLGSAEGFLNLKEMTWARRPNPEVPYYRAKLTDVGQALTDGDVILVKLAEQTEEGRWRLELEQEPLAQGAIVSMEAATGHIKALVGGRDFAQSQFNRATQAYRQPGSAFKPFIYAAALDKGFTPTSIILDSPVVYAIPGTKQIWKPQNYSQKFYGPTTLRTAIEKSRNVVTVKLLDKLGLDYAIEYIKELGIESPLTPNLSLALGTNEVTALEMCRGYSTFCNLGLKTEPIFVTRVEDRNGLVVEENNLRQERAVDPETAYIMTSLMTGVVKNGTGWRIKALGRPAAGKTGTTNDLRDAWFCGYTPDYVTIVWVGHDDHSSMGKGETGSRAAAPIWLDYMQKATAGRPVRDFTPPHGVVFTRVDKETGLLAGPGSDETIVETFKPGTEPTQPAQMKSASSPMDFLKEEELSSP